MANNKRRVFILIILVVVLAWVALRLSPFQIAPFGVVTSVSHSISNAVEKGLFRLEHFTFPYSLIRMFSLILLGIWILVIAWVYRDAERRGMNGLLWALLVLIGNLIGLIIYLIIRNDSRPRILEEPVPVCPGCGIPVQDHFAFCPGCGQVLKPQCPKCQSQVREEWKICPRCGANIEK